MKEFLYLHIYMFRCSFDGFVKLCLFLKVQLILDYFHTKAQFIIFQSGELHFGLIYMEVNSLSYNFIQFNLYQIQINLSVSYNYRIISKHV